jgi:hypothetical protein
MSDVIARRLESEVQRVLLAGGSLERVLRWGESTVRRLPCVVVEARVTGEELGIVLSGVAGLALELRVHAMVAEVRGEDAGRAVEVLAERARVALESDSGLAGFSYLRIERTGEEREIDESRRVVTAVYTAVAV